MAWYINMNGQVSGPADDAQVLGWISARRIIGAKICQVGSQTWADLASHPPFAAALRLAMPPPPTGSAPGVSAKGFPLGPPKKPMSPAAKLTWWIIGLVIGAFVFPPLGVLAGLALVGLSEFARRKRRISFVSWVLKRSPSTAMCIASLVLGAVLLLAGGSRLVGVWLGSLAAEREAKAHAVAEANRKAALLADLPRRIADWRAKLSQVNAAAEAASFVEGELATAQTVTADIDAVKALLGTGAPPDLAQVRQEADAATAKYKARADFNGHVLDFGQQVIKAKGDAKSQQWLTADGEYATADQDLSALGQAAPELAQFLPAGFDVAAKHKELAAMRAQIAGPVAAEKRRIAKEAAAQKADEAKQVAYASLCGEKPVVSAWDGALIGLESSLKETANDPDSIEVRHCTEPVLSNDNCWISSCDVRGKNAFGAKILKHMTFSRSSLGFQEVN